jgi:excisionase family DNA binding protein
MHAMDKWAGLWTADSGWGTGAPGWLSASAAAVALGVSQRTIRRAIARGDLPAAKQAGVYRIAPADLAHYRARGRVVTPATPPTHQDPVRLIPFPGRGVICLTERPEPALISAPAGPVRRVSAGAHRKRLSSE